MRSAVSGTQSPSPQYFMICVWYAVLVFKMRFTILGHFYTRFVVSETLVAPWNDLERSGYSANSEAFSNFSNNTVLSRNWSIRPSSTPLPPWSASIVPKLEKYAMNCMHLTLLFRPGLFSTDQGLHPVDPRQPMKIMRIQCNPDTLHRGVKSVCPTRWAFAGLCNTKVNLMLPRHHLVNSAAGDCNPVNFGSTALCRPKKRLRNAANKDTERCQFLLAAFRTLAANFLRKLSGYGTLPNLWRVRNAARAG